MNAVFHRYFVLKCVGASSTSVSCCTSWLDIDHLEATPTVEIIAFCCSARTCCCSFPTSKSGAPGDDFYLTLLTWIQLISNQCDNWLAQKWQWIQPYWIQFEKPTLNKNPIQICVFMLPWFCVFDFFLHKVCELAFFSYICKINGC